MLLNNWYLFIGFVRYPLHPILIHFLMVAVFMREVTIMIFTLSVFGIFSFCSFLLISFNTLRPLIPGIETSRVKRSKGSFFSIAFSKSAIPFFPSSTVTHSLIVPIIFSITLLEIVSSSTIKVFNFIPLANQTSFNFFLSLSLFICEICEHKRFKIDNLSYPP